MRPQGQAEGQHHQQQENLSHQHHDEGEPGTRLHHHQEGGGVISCEISMHIRMPRSISWATQDGITPIESDINEIVTPKCLHEIDEKETGGQEGGTEDQVEGQQHHLEEVYHLHHQHLVGGEQAEEGDHCKERKERIGGPQKDHQGGQELEEGDHHHHPQHQGGGEKSCNSSMHIRMPGPKLQAPQGGTSPRTSAILPESNTTIFSEERRKEDKPNLDQGGKGRGQ